MPGLVYVTTSVVLPNRVVCTLVLACLSGSVPMQWAGTSLWSCPYHWTSCLEPDPNRNCFSSLVTVGDLDSGCCTDLESINNLVVYKNKKNIHFFSRDVTYSIRIE